jgi:hypothetical protein
MVPKCHAGARAAASRPTSPVASPDRGPPVGAMGLHLFASSDVAAQLFFDMLTRGWLGKEMRALGRLASVSPALRLLADAVAHIAVAFHDHSLLLGRGRAGATRWFSVLRDLNTIRKTMPLRFTLAAAGIDITAAQGWRQPEITGTVVERPRFGHGFTITGSAVCADCVMRTGIHCAVFTLLEDCDPAVDRVFAGVCDFAKFKPNDYAYESADAWTLHTLTGQLANSGELTNWSGMAPMLSLGDTIDLVLDLDSEPALLSVALNGVFSGVMCELPDAADGFCWLVTLDAESTEDDSSGGSSSDSEPGTPSSARGVPAHFAAVNPHARAAVRIERRAPPTDLTRQMSILNLSAGMV